MEIFKKRFEEDLKNRVNQKRQTNQREDQFIFKKFKHYDNSNSGKINLQGFLNVMEGCGVNIINKKMIQEIFYSYIQSDHKNDNNDLLDYQSFVTQIFGKQTTYDNYVDNKDLSHSPQRGRRIFPMKENESFLNFQQNNNNHLIDDNKNINNNNNNQLILTKFQNALRNKSDAKNLLSLYRSFTEIDNSGKREIGEQQFVRLIKNLQINLTENDIKCLYLYQPFQKNGHFNYDRFIQNSIQSSLTQDRLILIQELFQKIDYNNHGVILIDQLIDSFDAQQQPDQLLGKKTSKECLYDFLKSIEDYCQTREDQNNRNELDLQSFILFFSILSFFIMNISQFQTFIQRGWKLSSNHMASQQDTERILENNYHKLSQRSSKNNNNNNNIFQNNNNYSGENSQREDYIQSNNNKRDVKYNQENEIKRQQSNSENEDQQKNNNNNSTKISPRIIQNQKKQNQKSDIFNLNNDQPIQEQKPSKNFSKSPIKNRYNIVSNENNNDDFQEGLKSERFGKRVINQSPFSQKYNIISGANSNNNNNMNNNQEDQYNYQKKQSLQNRQNSFNNILSHQSSVNDNQLQYSQRQKSVSPFKKDSGNIIAHIEQSSDHQQQLQQQQQKQQQRSISPIVSNFNIISNLNNNKNENINNNNENIITQTPIKNKQNYINYDNGNDNNIHYNNHKRDKSNNNNNNYNKEDDFMNINNIDNQIRKNEKEIENNRYEDMPLGSSKKGKRSITPSRSNAYNIINNETKQSNNNNNNINNKIELSRQDNNNNINKRDDDKTYTRLKQERENESIIKQTNTNNLILFQKKIISRGVRGYLNFWKKLLNHSLSSNQINSTQQYCINEQQFKKIMKLSRLDFDEQQINSIYEQLVKSDRNNLLYISDILSFIKGKNINKNRLGQIQKIYHIINNYQKQNLSYSTLINRFSTKNNTDVRKGKQTSEYILIDFLENLENHHSLYKQQRNQMNGEQEYNYDDESNEDDEIDLDEFIQFYTLYSLQYEEDHQFETYLFQSYAI